LVISISRCHPEIPTGLLEATLPAAAEFPAPIVRNLHPARDVLRLLRVLADGHHRAMPR